MLTSHWKKPMGTELKGWEGVHCWDAGPWCHRHGTGMVPAASGKATWADLATFKMHAPCDPEIPLLRIFPCKMPKMSPA